ncbi:hypothetical protein JZ751_022897 [Albula glossodonta]|uniref:Uncharacterized protein n=1 Tax=Albula glossodonta TaxID=121402 RepID=A0A8T2PIS8_9TELE|nr:hypothetical protein JZ751_022897 [Albula glossodonta]
MFVRLSPPLPSFKHDDLTTRKFPNQSQSRARAACAMKHAHKVRKISNVGSITLYWSKSTSYV